MFVVGYIKILKDVLEIDFVEMEDILPILKVFGYMIKSKLFGSIAPY